MQKFIILFHINYSIRYTVKLFTNQKLTELKVFRDNSIIFPAVSFGGY